MMGNSYFPSNPFYSQPVLVHMWNYSRYPKKHNYTVALAISSQRLAVPKFVRCGP